MKCLQYSGPLLIALIFLAGCRESDSQLVRRAQLVGNENIQLKKQLEAKDKEIQALEQKMATMQQDYEKQIQGSGESNFKLLEIVSQTTKELEDCKAELERLRGAQPQ